MENTLYKNNFVNNSENAFDDDTSNLYSDGIGNYWSDYLVKYPTAQSQNNIWDVPYSIPVGTILIDILLLYHFRYNFSSRFLLT